MENKSWQEQVEEGKVKLYLPKPPSENVTTEMREGGFHMDSYILGRRHAINDCIHYLKQQGYRVAHENDNEDNVEVINEQANR